MKPRTIIAGGLLAILLIGSLGVVYTTAQTTTTNQTTDSSQPAHHNTTKPMHDNNSTMPPHGHGRDGLRGCIPPGINLTTEQRQELNETIASLSQENATAQEIQAAIRIKLDEFGVFDAQLNASINQTELRLKILKREQALRDQGYNWTQIESMIASEFGTNTTGPMDHNNMMDQGFGCGGPRGRSRPDW
jgi:hypothetical protein